MSPRWPRCSRRRRSWDTAAYYHGVLTGEVAARGSRLWAPLSLHVLFDVMFLVVAIPLSVAVLRVRPAAWELAALAVLGAMAVQANRNTVWFALFLAVPAAGALRFEASRTRRLERVVLLCACLLGVGAVAAAAREPVQTAAGSELLLHTAAAAGDKPVLADPINAERLALAGQTIWIGNPLDAFSTRAQRVYLDWLDGRAHGDSLLTGRSCAILVTIAGALQPASRTVRPTEKWIGTRRQCCTGAMPAWDARSVRLERAPR